MKSKAKAKTKASIPISSDHHSVLFWLMLSMVGFFMLYAAFHTGLFNGYSSFYDTPIYSAVLASSIMLIMAAIHFCFKWKLEDNRDLLSMYIWLVPLTFWIAVLPAASADIAKNMAMIHMMYAALFIAGAYLARNDLGARALQLMITLVGYIVVLYGLACAFGNLYSRDAVMLTDQGYRLTSVFQYANAYAAFLIAVLLCCLYYITHSKKWHVIFVNSLMIVPILVSFWLTLSRGGIVMLPVIFLAILPLMPLTRQLALSVYVMFGVIGSFPITGFVTNRSTDIVTEVFKTLSQDMNSADTLSWFNGDSLGGWGVVLGVSLVVAGIITSIQHYAFGWLEQRLEVFSSRKRSRLILPVGLVAAGALGAVLLLGTPVKHLLPEALETRLSSINFQQHSVLERVTFYKDSIKLFKDYPLIGAGGGGWAVLYEKYQNNPYVSRQAHNFFLQYLNEVGIIGLAVFLGLLIITYTLFIKKSFSTDQDKATSRLIFYLVSISILLHSILDFELSYVFLGGLVFLCLGGLTSILDGKPRWLPKLSLLISKRVIYPATISAIALLFFIMAATHFNADKSYNRAVAYANQGKPINEILVPLDAAIKSNPKPDYYALKSNFLLQIYSQLADGSEKDTYWNNAKAVLEEARKAEPNNRQLLEQQYNLYIAKQDFEAALAIVREGLDKYPWEISFYERAAGLNNTLWNQARQQNDQSLMDRSWQEIQEIYTAVQEGITHLETLPEGQMQGREFYYSAIIRYSVGQIYALKGELDNSFNELQLAGTEANEKLPALSQAAEQEQHKTIIRWYLALAQKLGKPDQAMYDSFIGTYPEDKAQIDAIAASLQ